MFEKFERIYVINLPNRTDRRKETEIELSKAGGPLAIFFPAIRPPEAGKFRSIGERGCFVVITSRSLGNVLVEKAFW